jgi:hypothetical protein
MNCTIFYAWQGILPNSTNRGFIQTALEEAARELRADDSLKVEPIIDRDTQGLPGAPDIGLAIFAKIDRAAVFVGDVSIVHPEGVDRRTPNPNVLVELGYALKALGPERIVPVMNTAFGGPELLPFDLKQKRTLTYELAEGAPKPAVRKELVAKLKHALRAILDSATPNAPSPVDAAIEAIDAARADQGACVRRYMQWLDEQLAALDPHAEEGDPVANLRDAIDRSAELVLGFGRVASRIAAMNSAEAGRALVKGFEYVLRRYRFPAISGSYTKTDFDFFKFVGHELVVTLAAHLLREDRGALLGQLLRERIYQPNGYNGLTQLEAVSAMSDHVQLLEQERGRSAHGDILKARHQSGPLAADVPWDEFLNADFLLFLAFDLNRESWRPWSYTHLTTVPRCLLEATSRAGAARLRAVMNAASTAQVRSQVADHLQLFRELLPLSVVTARNLVTFDVSSIAEA